MKQLLKQKAARIDAALHEYMPIKENPQKIIYEAMNYSLFAGGKRLRPILMTEVCEMCGGRFEDVIPFAAAMEMIHTYSLIHDDLPAMDDDDLRRGMPTNHIKFGYGTAILAGDALLTKAFEIMSGIKSLPAETVLRAINMIAESAGTEGMVGGQIVDIYGDILGNHDEMDIENLKYMDSLKTGAIIRSSCKVGALIGGADESAINAVDKFALNLGIAFQIQDDILDVIGNESELGKPVGSDVALEKNTYIKLLGVQKSQILMEQYYESAAEYLARFGEKADFLVQLTKYLTERSW